MLSVSNIIIISIIGIIVITWYRQLQAKEFAYQQCIKECKRQNYQLLDQTVALQYFKITRQHSSAWYIYRQYSFDYTETNLERYQGYIEMHGLTVITLAFKNDIVGSAQAKTSELGNKIIPFPKPTKKR